MDSEINVVWVALQEMEKSGRCIGVQEKNAGGVRNFLASWVHSNLVLSVH